MLWSNTQLSAENTKYDAWPGICRLHDGTLLAVWSQGTSHTPSDHDLYLSKYDGANWSAPALFHAGGDYSVNCPMILEVQIGGVWHILVSFQRWNGEDMYDANRKVYLLISADGGTNWGANSPNYNDNNRITVAGTGANALARGTRCRPVLMSNDEIAVATYNNGPYHTPDAPTKTFFNYASLSNLTNWTEVEAASSTDPLFYEPVIAEIKDALGDPDTGTIYMILGTSGSTNLYRVLSTNYGRAWGSIGDTGIKKNASTGVGALDITRLGGDVHLAYMYRRLANDGVCHIRKAVSEDGDIVWATPQRIWEDTAFLASDLGYPSICSTPGGVIAVLYCGSTSATNILFIVKWEQECQLKVWDGASWKQAKPKVWDGAAWTEAKENVALGVE